MATDLRGNVRGNGVMKWIKNYQRLGREYFKGKRQRKQLTMQDKGNVDKPTVAGGSMCGCDSS